MNEISIACINEEARPRPVSLSLQQTKMLFDGILNAFEELGDRAKIIEVVTVKPISLGASFNNTKVTIVLLNPLHKSEKMELVFNLEPKGTSHITDEIIREIQKYIENHCYCIKQELKYFTKNFPSQGTCATPGCFNDKVIGAYCSMCDPD